MLLPLNFVDDVVFDKLVGLTMQVDAVGNASVLECQGLKLCAVNV